MALLDLTATTDDARAGTSISALGTASTIAVKVRLNGACLLSPAAYGYRIFWEIGSLAGARRCNLRVYHDPGPTPDEVSIQLLNNGGSSVAMTYDRTAVVSGNYYIIYTALGPGGWDLKLFASDGTQLASNTNADTSGPGASNSANGKLSVGQGVDTATTTDSVVGYVDGIAVYSAVLAGDARWGAPAAADANILSFVGFDEGTGTTANDVATGGSDLTLSGAGWQAGGTWSGDVAPVLSSPTAAKNGSTACTGTVTTDESGGTLYWVVSTASNAPSAAQVQAGQMHTGAAGAASGSQAVSATGVQNISDTGLTASTTYYIHYNQDDSAGNDSNVVSSASFTTDAATNDQGIKSGASFITSVIRSIVQRYAG